MDVTQIKAIIDTMGFPIFICLVLLWFIKGTLAKHSELMGEIQKSLAGYQRRKGNFQRSEWR